MASGHSVLFGIRICFRYHVNFFETFVWQPIGIRIWHITFENVEFYPSIIDFHCLHGMTPAKATEIQSFKIEAQSS